MKLMEVIGLIARIYSSEAGMCIAVCAVAGMALWSQHIRHKMMTEHPKTKQQKAAQSPPIAKRWRQKIPQGLVLGKVNKKEYFCLPEMKTDNGFSVGHCLVMGGSGTGKTSSVYAESILADWNNKIHHPELFYTFLAVDIKGELHLNFCPAIYPPNSKRGHKNPYYLLDPTDRDLSYGYNPFCLIDDADYVTHDLIIQVSSDIASAFVSVGEKDKYFSQNALSILTGLVAYCIEHSPRIELVDMMQRIISEDVKQILQEIYEEALPDSVAMHFLGRFQGKGKDNESFDDIISTLTTQLNAFALDSVVYMLKDNPHRISVADIRRKPIILSVPDSMLDENTFAPVYRMVLASMQRYLISKIPKPGTRPVVLFYDELFSLGGSEKGNGIADLQHFMSIARQYGAAVVAAVQSEKMLVKQYGREGSKILEDNMAKVILQLTDVDSIRSAIDWTGKFDERNQSISTGSKMSGTISWSKQNIFDSSDFTSLVGQQKVIVVPLDDHFMRIKKSQWFKEPDFKEVQKQITAKPEDRQKEGKT